MPDKKHSELERELSRYLRGLKRRNPYETEFRQAVTEVAESVMPFVLEHPEYKKAQILERLTEPDRIITFRVTWEDDQGNIRAQRAWRVQMSNAIGPYKGGLRFHRELKLDTLKFLAFEQCFKNSLTGLPLGAGKGGSNFNPRGKSDHEVMRFCHSMMTELHRHIGEDVDVPAGDIGVGQREISYLFGQYLRLANRYTGVLTGKGLSYGGSAVRTEATGYGCVYFLQHMLDRVGDGVEGKTAVVSGAGNVALHAIEKLDELGALPVTASDSEGFVYDPDGITGDKLLWLKELKLKRRGRVREYAEHFGCEYVEGRRPWTVPCDFALPCAVQNELDEADARALVKNGVKAVAEGANMPTTRNAISVLQAKRVLYAPGKASNAGGVAVSGLEQSQNALRLSWSHEEVDDRLKKIIKGIHDRCIEHGKGRNGRIDYVKGANLAGFLRVADALLAYGAV
ncbi:MAG: NADP-specific glutamate dehydrogenase [Planctomycetota bacterium]|jgi:glutamate dehydrogenase (NADP+)